MPDFKPYPESELREIDQKVNKEMKRINVVDWTVSLLTVGVLWALYERLKKPIFKNLDIFAAANISKEHILGKRRPGGALGKVENIKDVLPFNRIQRNMLRFAQMSAAENIAQMSDRTKHTLRLMLTRSKLQGTSPKELAEQMRLTFKGLDRDWRRIVVTESANVATNGYLMSQPEGAQIVGQSAVDACKWCLDMIHGKIFTVTHIPPTSPTDPKWDDFVWPGKNNILRSRHAKTAKGKRRGAGEIWKPCITLHPHCFPPGQLVRCPDGMRKIEKISEGDYVIGHSGESRKVLQVHNSRYVGELFSINSGAFTSTFNHPVFIYRRGWVEAQKIKKGDSVLSAKSVTHKPDYKKRPSTPCKHFLFSDIIKFFSRSPVPSPTMYLDGDFGNRDCDVDVVFPNGPETVGIYIKMTKKGNHSGFAHRKILFFMNQFRSFFQSLHGLLSPTHGIMCGEDLKRPLSKRHLRPSNLVGIGLSPPGKTEVFEPFINAISGNSKRLGNIGDGFSGEMSSVRGSGVKDFSINHNLLYQTVDVDSIMKTRYSGPVYNLTVEGDETYLIGEQSVLVHNCRCRYVAYNPRFHEVSTEGFVRAK